MPKKDSSKSKISRKSSEHGKERGTKGSSAKIGRKMSADASDASDDSGENTRRADKLKRNKTLDGHAETTSVAYQDILDTVAKVVRINSVALSEESRMHSGLLGLDLILGRGIGPTWCTFAGPEQSAKTTLAITVMAATINQKVPISVLWDAEQSSGSSADYVANVLAGQNVHNDISEVFGVRKHGKWVTRPLVYYQDETNGEVFFNWLHALGKRLPDKRFENERWWYVYENTKDNIAKYGSKADKTLSKANHGLWLPAEDDSLQAVIILDSYPSLMPTAQDNDEHTKAMAVQARMFSLHLPRVKGFVRSKRIAILGINQIRMNPGAMFGSPEVEPCGAALKFFSDQRVKLTPRALSAVPFNPKGEGQYETEPSIDGGVDKYRYVRGVAFKNKLGTPNQDMWFRLWVEDSNGEGRGYDLVWDTFYTMFLCGLITGKRHAMKLNVPGLGEGKRSLNWLQFKTLILGSKEQRADICKTLGWRTVDLRKGLINLTKKGVLDDLYWQGKKEALVRKKSSMEVASTDDDDDEDED